MDNGKLCGCGKLDVGLGVCGKLWFWVGTRSGFPVGVGSLLWVRRAVRPFVFGLAVVFGSVPLLPVGTSAYLFHFLFPVA